MNLAEQAGSTPYTTMAPPRVWPMMADFWRRIGAAGLDCVLIGLVGQVIARPFTTYWSQIGPYGRFVGIAVVLTYLGVMNSWLGNGQTLGKRWMKIAVRGRDNEPISLGRSVLRASILAAPFFLYGWALPALRAPQMGWLTGLLVFGLGAALVCTMVLNVDARQGIHDLICGTYVVDTTSVLVDEFPRSERFHWIMAGAVLGIATIACAAWNALPPPVEVAAPLQDVRGLKEALQGDDRFFTSSVDLVGLYSGTLQVDVWYRGVRTEEEQRQLRLDIARLALEHVERVYQFDYLSINIRSAYDLGIAAGQDASDEIHWIPVWRRLVASKPQPFVLALPLYQMARR